MIYTNRFKKPEKYKLYKDYFIDKDKLCACNKSHTAIDCVIKLDKLFETRKQAEWSLKYQHIPRTEELNLPMWEEFKKDYTGIFSSIRFIGCDWEIYQLYFSREGGKIYLDDYYEGDFSSYKQWQATEENYIKACDLCVKLFKGE